MVNDERATAVVERVATSLFGAGSVTDTPQSRGGDSFAWYTEQIPGTYVRLGTHRPGNPHQDLHSATFDVDEGAIAVAAALLAGCALESLRA